MLRKLDSNVRTGLTTAEFRRRIGEYGLNQLPEGRKQGPLVRFPKQCKDILVYVPLAAGFVKLMMGVWLDAAIILGVVIINGF